MGKREKGTRVLWTISFAPFILSLPKNTTARFSSYRSMVCMFPTTRWLIIITFEWRERGRRDEMRREGQKVSSHSGTNGTQHVMLSSFNHHDAWYTYRSPMVLSCDFHTRRRSEKRLLESFFTLLPFILILSFSVFDFLSHLSWCIFLLLLHLFLFLTSFWYVESQNDWIEREEQERECVSLLLSWCIPWMIEGRERGSGGKELNDDVRSGKWDERT